MSPESLHQSEMLGLKLIQRRLGSSVKRLSFFFQRLFLRESTRGEGQRERGTEDLKRAPCWLHRAYCVRLELTNQQIMTWAQVRCLTHTELPRLPQAFDSWSQLRSWFQGGKFKPRVGFCVGLESYLKKKNKNKPDSKYSQMRAEVFMIKCYVS